MGANRTEVYVNVEHDVANEGRHDDLKSNLPLGKGAFDEP